MGGGTSKPQPQIRTYVAGELAEVEPYTSHYWNWTVMRVVLPATCPLFCGSCISRIYYE
jgi:NAD-dependent dihydropyrimidine dehydrogenase PreA subunit